MGKRENFSNGSRSQLNMTATPFKYPQGRFNDKKCKECSKLFSPIAPSHLFCSQPCFEDGFSRKYLNKTYNITLEEYREMFIYQEDRCAICGGLGFKMADNVKKFLVVDHCHSSGKVRGLLCHNCNRGLGLFQDSVENLNAAIDYLERATTISKESTPEAIAGGSVQHPLQDDDIV